MKINIKLSPANYFVNIKALTLIGSTSLVSKYNYYNGWLVYELCVFFNQSLSNLTLTWCMYACTFRCSTFEPKYQTSIFKNTTQKT